MELVTALLVGVPAQIGVFALVPLAWWLQAGRPEGSLWRWLGFRGFAETPDRALLIELAFCGLGFFGAAFLGRPAPWAGSAHGLMLVLAVAITAVLQTALSEELFFRGFLLRWLVDPRPGKRRPGPLLGNVLQASLCGVLQMGAQWIFVNRGLMSCLAALAFGAGAAFLAGRVRLRTGSLLLPWAAHGAGSLIAGLIVTLR